MNSLAIAGAWGYIGRKFVDAGLSLGLDVSVLDPGPAPLDVDLDQLRRFTDDSFYQQPVDLYHLALHPEHRQDALRWLLQRGTAEPIAILNEKPMATPECPQDAVDLIASLDGTQVTMWFDFPELFDPLTAAIVSFLDRFDEVQIDEVRIQRSKDREDPDNRRNDKRMVPIQYQETVHCLAWLLAILGLHKGGADAVLDGGVTIAARARPYSPPNPDAYDYVVDGRVDYELSLGQTAVTGCTDFTRGASWAKARWLKGQADGKPFDIEVDYLEGAKRLRIDGVDQPIDPSASSYEGALRTVGRWLADPSAPRLCEPTCAFTQLTYQLSSLLWRCSFDGQPRRIADSDGVRSFDAGFAAAAPTFPRYA